MTQLGDILRDARLAAQLSEAELAELVDATAADVAAYEAGRVPSMAALDRYACSFGVSVKDLLAGQAMRSPAAVLFRSMVVRDELRPALRDLVKSGVHRIFGEFLREVRERVELAELLGGSQSRPLRDWMAKIRRVDFDSADLLTQAATLAAEFRGHLGLGPDEPVRSVKQVAYDLGIQLHFVQEDELDSEIQGAAVLVPQPAIFVNLGGRECWWRTRMTIAHELCHLLFDRDILAGGDGRFAIFSPKRRPKQRYGWELVDQFDALESRANAFAAFFLAPSAAVRSLVERRGLAAASEAAISEVCARFAVGRATAINRLQDVFGLSDAEREHMVGRAHGYALATTSPDTVDTAELGPRGERFSKMVMAAFEAATIDANQARQYLRLRLSEPLPGYGGTAGDPREPWITAERLALATRS